MTKEAAQESTLLNVAHPQVYIRNAFRDTGLPVDATQKDVVRCGDRLRMAAKLGGAMPSGPLPTDPVAGEDEVRDALRQLQNPERRLIEELFWFWPIEGSSTSDDEALQDLAAGRVEDAVESWREIREFDTDIGVATHNLAVYEHLTVLDMESKLVKGTGLSEQECTTLDKAWKDALGLWTEMLESDDVWARFEERIRDIDDPRLTTAMGREIREELPTALLSINARLAVHFAERDHVTHALRHRQLMFGSSLGEEGLQGALHRAVAPIRTRLNVLGELAAEEADLDPTKGKTAADSLLEQAAPLVAVLDAVLPDNHPALEATHDEVALKVLGCQVTYGNKTNDWDGSIATLERASALAVSESARQRIANDLTTARANAESGDSYCGPGYYDQPKKFLDRMERARRAADALRWEDAVQILLKLLKKGDLTDEQRALVRKALAFCLDGKALRSLNDSVEKLNEPPKIIEKIHQRAQRDEIDGYTMTVASTGVQNEYSSLWCMACGSRIQEQFVNFTFNDVACIVCPPCSMGNERETEKKKERLQKAIKEVAPDLLLAAELDPDNKAVETNLEGLRDIASQEGVSIPGDAFERQVELGLVSVAELVEAFTNGGWGKRSAAKSGLERDAPDLLAELLARRRAKAFRWAKLSSAAAAALVVLYNLIGGLAGVPGPTYRLHRMGLSGQDRTVGVLARAMERGDFDARDKSVERLVEIGVASIPSMLEALRSESMRAREAAAAVIVRLGDAAAPVVLSAGSHANPEVRAAAAAVIGSFGVGDHAAEAILDSLSRDSNEEVVTAARSAIRHRNMAIVVGDTLVGKLDSEDEPMDGTGTSSRYLEQWRLLASEGECFGIRLTSLEGWTNLSVSGPGLSEPVTNDEYSQFSICAPTTGIYDVEASNQYGSAAYVLAVDSVSEVEATTAYLGSTNACGTNPTPVGELRFGEPEAGTLSRGDPTCVGGLDRNGRYIQLWTLTAEPGQRVTIDLMSREIDPYLFIAGPGLGTPRTDDDGGDGNDSRMTFTVPQSGMYYVGASTYSERDVGSYTIVADASGQVASSRPSDRGTCAEDAQPAGELSAGVLASGRLGSEDPTCLTGLSRTGNYLEKWTFEGTSGQLVTISMMSSDVDPYLILTGPGITSPRTDDDGGSGYNAQMTLRLSRSGTFNVYASTYAAGDPGPYTIRLTESSSRSVAPAQAPTRTRATAPACDPTILPVGELRTGVELRGEFGREDPVCLEGVSRTGRYMEKWTLRGTAGQSVIIDMASTAVDPFLMIMGPGLSSTRTDDDGGNGNNAQLQLTIPQSGTFDVYASTYSAGESGPYVIRLVTIPPRQESPETGPACVSSVTPTGVLRAGETMSGRLGQDDPTCITTVSRTGRYIDVWTLQGTAGRRITVDMMSNSVDPYLLISGPGITSLQTDDDGGDGSNARLQLTLPQTGNYTVYASAYSEGSAGSYTIALTSTTPSGAPAVTSSACDVIPPLSGMLIPNEVSRGEFNTSDPTCMRAFDRTGRYVDLWVFNVETAQRVTIDMISDDVDSYLALYTPETDDAVTDDDGGDGSNARLTVQAQAGTPTVVIATTFGERESGSYTLRLRVGGN